MTIQRGSERPEYWFLEGCWITELSNDEADPALSVARARVAPGTSTRWHALDDITERYVILSGCGRVGLQDAPETPVVAGDVVVIAPGRAQRITNTGPDDLVFLAVCTPRFRPECYRDLEADGG